MQELVEELPSYLEDMEKQRKRALLRLRLSYLLYLSPVASFGIGMLVVSEDVAPFFSFLGIVLVLYLHAEVITKQDKQYRDTAKQRLFQVLIEQAKLSFQFFPNKTFDKNELQALNLFRKTSKVEGEDLFEGNVKGYKVQFSELLISSKSSKTTTFHFDGLLFKIDLGLKTKGQLKILGKHQSFNKLQGEDIEWKEVQQRVLEENVPGFSESFRIITEDRRTAAYVLNTQLLQLLYTFKQEKEADVRLGIREGVAYLAWGDIDDYFEPKITESLLRSKSIEHIVNQFAQCLEIITQLIDSAETVQQEINQDKDILDDKTGDEPYDALIIDD